jgi:hydrogenase expression/formation protein HypE
MSKFALDVLERCVFPFAAPTADPDVLVGAAFGEDAALTRVGDGVLVSHVDPIIGAIEGIGWLAVHVACNDVATTGVAPRWLQVLVIVPRQEDEALLAQIMQDVGRAAREVGASVIGGHTGYSAGVSRPLVAVTAFGAAPTGAPLVRTQGAQVGDQVLVTKGVGLEGTGILAADFADVARRLGLSQADLDGGRALLEEVSVAPEALALAGAGATSMHDVTRGGLLETLLEIALLSGVGLTVDAALAPRRPLIARFAQAFGFDPWQMISSGTLAATVPPDRLAAATAALRALGTPFGVIGEVAAGSGVTLHRNGRVERYTEIQCESDELARMWAQYPRG